MPAICRTKVAVIGRTSGEAGRNTVCTVGRHGGIHPGKLHLIVEIGAVAQAADHHGGADPPRGRNGEIVECDAGEFAARLPHHDPQVSATIAMRSSAENSGALPGWTPMAMTSRPASRAAWRTTSRWPLVTGSKEPG